MTEDELQEIELEHPKVTVSPYGGRTLSDRPLSYEACGGCPMTALGHVPYPCNPIRLVEEVRKLSGWVEFMEERLLRYDERWDREALP